MLGGRYLVIDGATPRVQGVVIEYGVVVASNCAVGNTSEVASSLVGSLIADGDFSAFDGLIYCEGPGSDLGVRSTLVSAKIWQMFSKSHLQLLSYNSFSMCFGLNVGYDLACSYGVGDMLLLRARDETSEQNVALSDINDIDKVIFLDTRHQRKKEYTSFSAANYDIAGARFNILSICRASTGEVKDWKNSTFKKWQ